MTELGLVRERFLRDPVPTRIGGLAANLGRIRSFTSAGSAPKVIESIIDESKHLIEWTAPDTDVTIAEPLVELQVELARWQCTWDRLQADPEGRRRLAQAAGEWSDRLLAMSGLLP